MKFIKIISFFVIFILFSSSFVQAQTPFQAGLNFMMTFPQNTFADNVDNIGLGGSGMFAYHFPESPFAIGAKIGFSIYGSETREEPFSTTIPDVKVDVTTTNSILMGHLLFRVQPGHSTFRPYLDGLIGFNYLSTETKIEDKHDWDLDDNVASSTNQDDGAFSYGGGAGLMIQVYSGTTDNDKDFTLSLDLGLTYLVGGEAEYLKEGSIRREDGKVSYQVEKSKTDVVNAYIGVVFSF